jgi:DNA-binding NarL/FixJ family response regulator
MSYRILIVDDHKIARQGLTSLLAGQKKFNIVGEAANGQEAFKKALQFEPDLILMDIGLPDINGIETTRRILEKLPETKLVAFSQQKSSYFVRKMIQAGAVGYVCKEDSIEEVILGMDLALQDRPYLSPSLSSGALKDYFHVLKGEAPTQEATGLTDREIEILQLIAEGKTSKEVAETLQISQKTVENHRHNLMEKLGVHTVAGLTKWAIREGLSGL